MSKIITYSYNIIVFIILFFLYFSCNKISSLQEKINKLENKPIKSEVSYQFDTVFVEKKIPFPVKSIEIKIDTIPRIVDTIGILREYYSLYEYSREFSDSNLHLTIKDYISENKFSQKGDISYKILRPSKIEKVITTQPEEKKKVKGMVGVGVNSNIENMQIFLKAGIINKDDNCIFIGYDPVDNLASLDMYFKIKLTK